MRTKIIRKKGKMKPKEKGKPTPHNKLGQSSAKSVRSIRGIYSGWKKAPKFILKMKAMPHIKMYVDEDGLLTRDRKAAVHFAHGYDNPSIKIEYWSRQIGVPLQSENI
jgi:hypothetical protein